MVKSFDEFCDKLLDSGFSMGGGNAKGIYAIIPLALEVFYSGLPHSLAHRGP